MDTLVDGTVDLYRTLGLDPSASPEVISAAYRALAKQLHPDAGGDADAFRALRDAYEVLSDPGRRAAYDATRAAATVPPPRSTPQSPAGDGPDPRPSDPSSAPSGFQMRPPTARVRTSTRSFAEPGAPIGWSARLAGVVVAATLFAVGVAARVAGLTYSAFTIRPGHRFGPWTYDGSFSWSSVSPLWVIPVGVGGAFAGGLWLRRERLGVAPWHRWLLLATLVVVALGAEFVFTSPLWLFWLGAGAVLEAVVWIRAERRAARGV